MTLGKCQQGKLVEFGACYSAMIQRYGCTDTYDGSVTDTSGPRTHALPHLEMKIDEEGTSRERSIQDHIYCTKRLEIHFRIFDSTRSTIHNPQRDKLTPPLGLSDTALSDLLRECGGIRRSRTDGHEPSTIGNSHSKEFSYPDASRDNPNVGTLRGFLSRAAHRVRNVNVTRHFKLHPMTRDRVFAVFGMSM